MEKKRIKQMAEMITNLKAIITPAIMEFSLKEWDEIMAHLKDRHSTIQGGSIIIDALGGSSKMKELKSKFQCKMFEALHSYAKNLHEANEIGIEIEETKKNLEKNKKIAEKLFG